MPVVLILRSTEKSDDGFDDEWTSIERGNGSNDFYLDFSFGLVETFFFCLVDLSATDRPIRHASPHYTFKLI